MLCSYCLIRDFIYLDAEKFPIMTTAAGQQGHHFWLLGWALTGTRHSLVLAVKVTFLCALQFSHHKPLFSFQGRNLRLRFSTLPKDAYLRRNNEVPGYGCTSFQWIPKWQVSLLGKQEENSLHPEGQNSPLTRLQRNRQEQEPSKGPRGSKERSGACGSGIPCANWTGENKYRDLQTCCHGYRYLTLTHVLMLWLQKEFMLAVQNIQQ